MEFFKIMSIDPGNNIGVSIYTISAIDFSIIDISTKLYVLDTMVSDHAPDIMIAKLHLLQSIITELCFIHEPVALGMELAFMNSRFPKAVMQLSQYVATIELAAINYNPFIKVFKYPPKYIKAIVAKTGNANKEDMLKATKKIPEVANRIYLDHLTEHEIDAISISYIVLLKIRESPFVLFAI